MRNMQKNRSWHKWFAALLAVLLVAMVPLQGFAEETGEEVATATSAGAQGAGEAQVPIQEAEPGLPASSSVPQQSEPAPEVPTQSAPAESVPVESVPASVQPDVEAAGDGDANSPEIQKQEGAGAQRQPGVDSARDDAGEETTTAALAGDIINANGVATVSNYAEYRAAVEGRASEILLTQDIEVDDNRGEVVDYDLTLRPAPGAQKPVVLTYVGRDNNFFRVQNGGHLTVEDVTFQQNVQSGALVNGLYLYEDGDLTAKNVKFTGFLDIGAIYVNGGNNISLENVVFEANSVGINCTHTTGKPIAVSAKNCTFTGGIGASGWGINFEGAGITAHSAGNVDIQLDGCVFEGNTWLHGSAIYGCGNHVEYTIQNTRFENNKAICRDDYGGHGGAIHVREGAKLAAENCDFVNNSAEVDGGSVYGLYDATLDFKGGSFKGNTAKEAGGAILAYDAPLSIEDVLFEGNGAGTTGGAVYAYLRNASITGATFKGNTAASNGGAVFGYNVKLAVEDTAFEGNTATYRGGAMYASATSPGMELEVDGATFEGNAAGYRGGGVHAYGPIPSEFTGTTFHQNKAGNSGGGAYFDDNAADVHISGGTFTENTSDGAGGGLMLYAVANTRIQDMLFEDNTAVSYGGGIVLYGQDVLGEFSQLEMIYTKLLGNEALQLDAEQNPVGGTGGGLYTTGHAAAVLQYCEVSGNKSRWGGGIRLDGAAAWHPSTGYDWPDLLLDDTLVQNNEAAGTAGGGVFLSGNKRVAAFYSHIVGNKAADGAGIAVSGTPHPAEPVVITGNTHFEGNIATGRGGGLFGFDGVGIQLDSGTVLEGNVAGVHGGGLYLMKKLNAGNTGTLQVQEAEFLGNKTQNGHGGGMYLQNGTDVRVEDSLFDGNEALYTALDEPVPEGETPPDETLGGRGGAIYFYVPDAHLVNNTFQNNRAQLRGGALDVAPDGALPQDENDYAPTLQQLWVDGCAFDGNLCDSGAYPMDRTAHAPLVAVHGTNVTGTRSLSLPFLLANGDLAYNNYDIGFMGMGPPRPLVYDGNGADPATVPGTSQHRPGETATVSTQLPVNGQKVFRGWRASHDGKLYARGGSFTMPNEDVTLRAEWSDVYTLRYDGNGHTGGALPAESKCAKGDTVTVTSAALRKTGHRFTGWKANFNGQIYTAGGTFAMPGSNVVLVAQWAPESTSQSTSTGRPVSTPSSHTPPPVPPPQSTTQPAASSSTRRAPTSSSRPVASSAGALAQIVPESKATGASSAASAQGGAASAAAPRQAGITVSEPAGLESIAGGRVPLLGAPGNNWALLNLLLAAVGVAIALVLLLLRGKKGQHAVDPEDDLLLAEPDEEQRREMESEKGKLRVWKIAAAVLALLGAAIFLLTQDISLPVAWLDVWTLPHLLLVAAEVVCLVLAGRILRRRKAREQQTAE